MKQNLRLLGLGLDTALWKKLTQQLLRVFDKDKIGLEFDLVKYKWSRFKESGLEKMVEFRPDFIVTSSDLFKGIEELEFYFQSYQPDDLIDYPSLILVDRNPLRFIRHYLKLYPYTGVHFRQYPRLRISNPDWIVTESRLSSLIEIQPLPELFFKERKDVFLDREKLVGFASWADIETIVWKEKRFTPSQFCDFFDKTYQKEIQTKYTRGILFDCGRSYFSAGFFMRDIVKMETASLPVEHVIGRRQLKAHHKDLTSLSNKLLETAKYRCSLHFNERYLTDLNTIKARIPVTISSDSALVCKVFQSLMLRDGYQKTVTTDQVDDSVDRFLVSLHTEPVEAAPFTFSIILDRDLVEIEAGDNLAAMGQLTETEWEDLSDTVLLHKKKNQVGKRLQKLKDQLKVLSSSKVESDKKRYMDMISRNKMEVIQNLLEISEIWDEHSCDVSVARQENVLILFNEEQQSKAIDQQLENNNRKVFINIVKQIMSLESLVNLNTEPLEHFLHDGVIICCMTTKTLLLRRFQQFEQALSQKKYPPLTKAISNLEAEIAKCIEHAQRLQLLDFASRLHQVYQGKAESLLHTIHTYFKEVERTRYAINNKGTICIIGDEEENCRRIASAIESTCQASTRINVRQIVSELSFLDNEATGPEHPLNDFLVEDHDEQHNSLLTGNLNELSRFYRHIASEIGLRDVDIFFLVGNPRVNQLLIEFLRQKGSKYINTPIVLLASGMFDYQLMSELSQDGVKVLYQDQFRRSNPEALTQTFKKLLFSFSP